MANLKLDLVNQLNNEKYYDEIELIRLAGDPNTNYKKKISIMSDKLGNIALVNAKIGLLEQYFKDQPQATTEGEAVIEKPQGHQGQSHGE